MLCFIVQGLGQIEKNIFFIEIILRNLVLKYLKLSQILSLNTQKKRYKDIQIYSKNMIKKI